MKVQSQKLLFELAGLAQTATFLTSKSNAYSDLDPPLTSGTDIDLDPPLTSGTDINLDPPLTFCTDGGLDPPLTSVM